MFFKRIESQGVSHYSYIIGDGYEAAVIDPRRDVDVYLEQAGNQGMAIKYIFETHRNEDYIIGSIELADKTGAKIFISGHEDLGHVYGEKIFDEDIIEIGELRIKAIHTPGHTLGHMSYAVYEKERNDPYMVFTGDCLFMGDLGRTDFYGEKNLKKTTGLLYDSIFNRLFALGDDVLVFPAHGPGSACGESMEQRPYTTMGYERKYNMKLQVGSKEEFIESFGKMRIKPRYFVAMEKYNVKGATFVGEKKQLKPLFIDEVIDKGMVMIDTRSKEAFYGGHIPGAIFFSIKNISKYIGTLFDTNTPIALITQENDITNISEIHSLLLRIGFEKTQGYIADGNAQWEEAGRSLEILKTISAKEYINNEDDGILLDIRNEKPLDEYFPSKNYMNIPLELLYSEYNNLPKDKIIYVLCGSGDRATTAASFLFNKGFDSRVITGGLHTLNPYIS